MVGFTCLTPIPMSDEHLSVATAIAQKHGFGPEGDHDNATLIKCELQPGHKGKHVGLIQGYSRVTSEGEVNLGLEVFLSFDKTGQEYVYGEPDEDYCQAKIPLDATMYGQKIVRTTEDAVYFDKRTWCFSECTLLNDHDGGHSFEFNFIIDDEDEDN
jgi:hypothetical protein